MPAASKEYCKKTPIKKMGFTQKASCKAQGFLKRISKKYKDKYIVSPKYKKTRKSKTRKSKSRKSRKRKKL